MEESVIFLVAEGVVADDLGELAAGEEHDGGVDSKLVRDRDLEGVCECGEVRVGLGGREHDIAALDVAHHIAMTERRHHLAELCHRDLVPAQDVDPSEEGDMSPHRLIIAQGAREGAGVVACLPRGSWRVFGTSNFVAPVPRQRSGMARLFGAGVTYLGAPSPHRARRRRRVQALEGGQGKHQRQYAPRGARMALQ